MKTPVLLALCLALFGCPGAGGGRVDAGPNLLDPAFGTQGLTRTAWGCHSRADALVAVGNGRVVAAGRACGEWAFAAYLSDGSLDRSYGNTGRTRLFADAGSFVEVTAMVARPDGRVIARGHAGPRDAIRQLSVNGMNDSAFAAAVDQALDPRFELIRAIALQPDGKLLVGDGENLTRLTPDGALDPTFGASGHLGLTLFGSDTFLTGALVHPDGRIVLSGLDTRTPYGEPFVAQLHASGAADLSFGTNGVVKLKASVVGTTQVNAIAIQSDGRLLLAGAVKPSELAHFRPALWRLTLAGILDPSFGSGGKAEAPTGGGETKFNALAVLSNGDLVAAGSYRQTPQFSESWLVARFTPSGDLDPTFGGSGFTLFDLGIPYSPGGAQGLAITPAGYVVAGPWFEQTEPGEFVVARVLP
jgi:uncharacterized delta-60 repeat protein